jgi:hypothetical protein
MSEREQLFGTEGESDAMDTEDDAKPKKNTDDIEKTDRLLGPPRPNLGTWAGCVRVYDPKNEKTLDLYEFDENECCTR